MGSEDRPLGWFERDAEGPGGSLGRVLARGGIGDPLAVDQNGEPLAGAFVFGARVHSLGGPFDLADVDVGRAERARVECGIYAVEVKRMGDKRLVLVTGHPAYRHGTHLDKSQEPAMAPMAAFVRERDRIQETRARAQRDLECADAEMAALKHAMRNGCILVIRRAKS